MTFWIEWIPDDGGFSDRADAVDHFVVDLIVDQQARREQAALA